MTNRHKYQLLWGKLGFLVLKTERQTKNKATQILKAQGSGAVTLPNPENRKH